MLVQYIMHPITFQESMYPSEKKWRNERKREGKKSASRHFKKFQGKVPCVKADGKRCKTSIGNGKFKVKDHVTVIAEPSGKLNEYTMFL